MQREPHPSRDIAELIRLECRVFAAKIRMARALLGWSQSELANRVGLTQRGIHKLEQGETDPRRATVRAIEAVWQYEGVEFEETADGGFRVTVRAALIDRSHAAPDRGAPSVVPKARAFSA
jgi:transcriptional regulator with XRE-family HTH domain